ncbi:hypothetical protein EV421DRAFT_1745124 [Armillaria borealis]|uniref:Uncharacterized protein n=1 Tax=Armillaria borealis TaxID=47425 RepID=A0AA39MDJ6_9AGAR|nr:hypothetical protein EV421DRAFT_1745124 [Armillaria borealis]
MSSWLSRKGVKSVTKLVLSAAINTIVLRPAFYVQRSVSKQSLFGQKGGKQNLRGPWRKAILDTTLCRFGCQVWWSGTQTLAIGCGWHRSNSLSGMDHYTIRGFNDVGRMVFTAELVIRAVDSDAWVYAPSRRRKNFKAADFDGPLMDIITGRNTWIHRSAGVNRRLSMQGSPFTQAYVSDCDIRQGLYLTKSFHHLQVYDHLDFVITFDTGYPIPMDPIDSIHSDVLRAYNGSYKNISSPR